VKAVVKEGREEREKGRAEKTVNDWPLQAHHDQRYFYVPLVPVFRSEKVKVS